MAEFHREEGLDLGATHYPTFDVLKEQTAWDEYSRSIVLQRLKPPEPTFLMLHEIDMLRAVVANLVYEHRPVIIDFIVSHIDKQLGSPIGESDREVGVPAQDILVRKGLAALNATALAMGGSTFDTSPVELQADIMQKLQKGHAPVPAEHATLPQKELFKKLLRLAVDGLSSHPTIWSEMGYAGPAYPRGYYRIERGLHDPWEAKAGPLSERGGTHNGAQQELGR